jgi:hypothetical protein
MNAPNDPSGVGCAPVRDGVLPSDLYFTRFPIYVAFAPFLSAASCHHE